MRWIPPAVIGILAALAAYGGPALHQPYPEETPNPLIPWNAWTAVSLVFYVPFLAVVVGGTAAAFRAMWIVTRRAELASELALGHTRSRLVRSHTVAGVREGAIAAGGGLAAGALVRQLQAGLGPGYWIADAVWLWLTVAIAGVAFLAGAYAMVAAWATRGSVREIADGARPARSVRETGGSGTGVRSADARAGTRRPSRRAVVAWAIVLGVIALCALAASLGWASAGEDEYPSGWQVVVAIVIATVLAAAMYLGIPLLLAYLGARASVWGSRRVLRALSAGDGAGSARSLAADALSRPTPLRMVAATALVGVMGVATAVTVIYVGSESRNALATDIAPHASVSTVELMWIDEEDDAGDSGWMPGMPATVLAELRADRDLTVVEAGVLLTDRRELTLPDGTVDSTVHRDVLLAVDAQAIDSVVPQASTALEMGPGVEWTYGALGWTGSFPDDGPYVEVDGLRRDTRQTQAGVPWSGIERAWAESVWGEAPTAAVLLYPAGDVPVSEALTRHDLDGLITADTSGGFGWGAQVRGGLVAAITAPFLAIAVAIVIALAWATQRLRAADQATLLALGATPGALRGAAALEALVPTLLATASGVVGGAGIGVILDGFNRGVFAAGGADAGAELAFTLASMPWAVLVALVLGSSLLAAAGAAAVRVRLDRLSPAQQLVEARKAGV